MILSIMIKAQRYFRGTCLRRSCLTASSLATRHNSNDFRKASPQIFRNQLPIFYDCINDYAKEKSYICIDTKESSFSPF